MSRVNAIQASSIDKADKAAKTAESLWKRRGRPDNFETTVTVGKTRYHAKFCHHETFPMGGRTVTLYLTPADSPGAEPTRRRIHLSALDSCGPIHDSPPRDQHDTAG